MPTYLLRTYIAATAGREQQYSALSAAAAAAACSLHASSCVIARVLTDPFAAVEVDETHDDATWTASPGVVGKVESTPRCCRFNKKALGSA